MEVFISNLHTANKLGRRKFVAAITGGGTTGISALLGVSGASSTILEATIPYAREATLQYIGAQSLSQFSSAATASSLSDAALRRAKIVLALRSESTSRLGAIPVGIACAAALSTNPPRRGEPMAHVAVATDECHDVFSIHFGHGAHDRSVEERVTSALVVAAAGEASGLGRARDNLRQLLSDSPAVCGLADSMIERRSARADPLTRLLLDVSVKRPETVSPASEETEVTDAVTHVLFMPPEKSLSPDAKSPHDEASAVPSVVNCPLHVRARTIIVPGSFNPLHAGHVNLARAAVAVASRVDGSDATVPGTNDGSAPGGWEAVFELSVANVDKPPLSRETALQRVLGIVAPSPGSTAGTGLGEGAAGWPVVVTSAPKFVDKARLLPGAWFAIGHDTAVRLVQGRYYEGGEDGMLEQLLALKIAGTRFLVAGRLAVDAQGVERFHGLRDMLPTVPSCLRSMFLEIPEGDFRVDLSSTQIREARLSHASPATECPSTGAGAVFRDDASA